METREHLALEVLKHWEDVPGGSILMPEYFETRSLYCNERPGEQVDCRLVTSSVCLFVCLFVCLSARISKIQL